MPYLGTYAFFLMLTTEDLQTDVNEYSSNSIFCRLDLVKMLWQKQCYIKYRHIQTNVAWKFLS